MNGQAYYAYQSEARGLRSTADVDALTATMSAIYDHFLPGWLPTDRSASIYEVACGPGIMLRYLRRAGYTHVAGSDSAACQVELARASGATVTQGDSLQELARSPDGVWDRVIAIDFIEHLPKDGLIEFLALANRKLEAGGGLILHAPNGDSPFVGRNLYNDITHYWAYTTIAMRALLQMAGFGRVDFLDESSALIVRDRWLKVPLMRVAQAAFRFLIRSAVKEYVEYLSPSIYVAAWK